MASRAIIHVDMDAFYASVEQRDDPRLRGREVIVGGSVRRGVVLAASYEVRPRGVRSAMPMARALKLAPDALVVPPRFSAYVEASEAVFDIFQRYTPLIEPLSLDEAFLDVTASRALFGAPPETARRIRAEIRGELGLPASAGIASSKFVAKIASDVAKPDGQREVEHEHTFEFIGPLPIGRLLGVGPKTEERLVRLGLRTIGEVARLGDERVRKLGLEGLVGLARGLDDRPVVSDREAKSLGAEDTFEWDVGDRDVLLARVHGQAERVGRRLRRAGLVARAVVLKLKRSDFRLLTRRTTLSEATDDGRTIFEAARELLDREWPLERKLRLTGVAVHDLARRGQLSLLGEVAKSARLNRALDSIADKFGVSAVVSADRLSEHRGEGWDDEARRRVGAARFDVETERLPYRSKDPRGRSE
ncbi:MAG: DNA polymerase IV [Deltaproteobacteria bacterium]|nr:DNA polymerase IV [Deltaproteobacteria bacterium]